MSDVASFLLARIAEDEAEAREYVRKEFYEGGWSDEHADRVLADCEAKREIVDRLRHVEAGVLLVGGDMANYRSALLWAARALATPYASHLDYQPEWAVTVSTTS